MKDIFSDFYTTFHSLLIEITCIVVLFYKFIIVQPLVLIIQGLYIPVCIKIKKISVVPGIAKRNSGVIVFVFFAVDNVASGTFNG